MNQIYFPIDILKRMKNGVNTKLLLAGFKVNSVFIVVQLTERNIAKYKYELQQDMNGLTIVGGYNCLESGLEITYDNLRKLPKIVSPKEECMIILFDPPNFKNLEYLTVEPILLQSIAGDVDDPDPLERRMEMISLPSSDSVKIDDVVLSKINSIVQTRLALQEWSEKKKLIPAKLNLNVKGLKFLKEILLRFVVCIAVSIEYICIFLIGTINSECYGYSLVMISQGFKQIDLRLRQINFFPVQLLCYYDNSVLYNDSLLLKKLKLPLFNSKFNINNSNYINFYNSLWLIFNDVILGMNIYYYIMANIEKISELIMNTLVKNILFEYVYDLISWVSFDHPAGFKLNNELGGFMGVHYLWCLKFWEFIMCDLIDTTSMKGVFRFIFPKLLKIICAIGASCLLAFMVDVIQILTLHLYCFYYASSRIYRQQAALIKSLFQLFRGKKYNVLRNRIDNMNDSSTVGDEFELDQLLVGTLLFMILMLLLPTVFAFYIMYFLMRLAVLMVINFIENINIVLNFSPLLVLLLKFKNSKRLQGGISFAYVTSMGRTDYLRLSNQSLSYKDIFKNFAKLPTVSKSYRYDIASSFFKGDPIKMKRNNNLKFQYLMLPEHYDKTPEIWKFVSI